MPGKHTLSRIRLKSDALSLRCDEGCTVTTRQNMTRIDEIEKAVEQLSPAEMAKFRAWFAELQGKLLDERIEADVNAGRLDWLAEEALAEHARGKTRKID